MLLGSGGILLSIGLLGVVRVGYVVVNRTAVGSITLVLLVLSIIVIISYWRYFTVYIITMLL